MNYIYLLFLSVFLPAVAVAQGGSFVVEVTTDTIYLGNMVGVKYTVKNIQGDFEPPIFDGFVVVGGPNVSNQFSMINGDVTQSASYEYILQPSDPGILIVSPALLLTYEDTIRSEAVQLVIVENPMNIRQDYRYYQKGLGVEVGSIQKRKMTKADSLEMKLKKLKARKI